MTDAPEPTQRKPQVLFQTAEEHLTLGDSAIRVITRRGREYRAVWVGALVVLVVSPIGIWVLGNGLDGFVATILSNVVNVVSAVVGYFAISKWTLIDQA